MVAYLSKVRDYLSTFEAWQIQQVPKTQNFKADSLAKLASILSSKLSRMIPMKCLGALSIQDKRLLLLITTQETGGRPLLFDICKIG